MAQELPRQYGRAVRRIIVLTPTTAPRVVQPVVLYEKKPRRPRRVSRLLRPLEAAVRKTSEAERAAMDTYVELHNRSNERKRNGWLRDMGRNVYKAFRAARKRLREEDDEDD